MRVLFVINSLGAGGTERSTAVLLPALRDAGVRCAVVILRDTAEGDEARVRDDGFPVHRLSGHFPGQVVELRRLLRRWQPDLVHTAIFEADVAGRLAAGGTGIPVVSSLVNTPYDPARRGDPRVDPARLELVRRIDAASARLATRFHAVSEGVARDATEMLGIEPDRITVVERGRDPGALGRRMPARRAAARAALGFDDDDEVVLAVGRQEFQKAHVDLIEAVAWLRSVRPRVHLLVAGRAGNASGDVAAMLDRVGDDRIRLLGHRDDVPDLMCAADVLAMPSLYEGTAGAAVEAMALELPVVCSRLVGVEGVLDDECAVLVPPGHVEELAAALASVLDDQGRALALTASGRARFEERFTLERSADGMATLYASVVGDGPVVVPCIAPRGRS
jgi:glycosyltransferase involved in cell wall biosynthesis